ncbi:hypothetical protein L7F22_068825 [Adiantum nelumboides]|nr:hypothetical protein [Adiantum nelumboides]
MAPPEGFDFFGGAGILEESLPEQNEVRKCDFPEGFHFGAATAAYQAKGGASAGGRGPSIWDTYSQTQGKILDGSSGDVACDHYHRYEDDVELLSNLGFDAYRFSISWSRILPDGFGEVANNEGVAFYSSLIDSLLKKGITPFATLYHWDLPQGLHDTMGGWLNAEIATHFASYAEVCFAAFGDRVKHWITLNEPLRFSLFGYGIGIHAPGRTSNRSRSLEGDTSTEPYITAHNALLAHAAAVDVYNTKFRAQQKGKVGIALDSEWGEPLTNSQEDREAAQRHLEFQLGWFLDPIYFGDYPESMRSAVCHRLPQFSKKEIDLLHGSLDFIGLNHYTTRFIVPTPPSTTSGLGWLEDSHALRLTEVDGKPIGDKGASYWMYIVPWGMEKMLKWITDRYNRPPIYITENGMDDEDSAGQSLNYYLHDSKRVKFYQDYLFYAAKAVRGGTDLRGYFAWSLLDNFEWQLGYTKRFGLVYVDFKDGLKRLPKDSALWFSRFLKSDWPWKQQEWTKSCLLSSTEAVKEALPLYFESPGQSMLCNSTHIPLPISIHRP